MKRTKKLIVHLPGKVSRRLNEAEKVLLIRKVKMAAVVQAEVWDAMRAYEDRTGQCIDLAGACIYFLAGETEKPPDTTQLSDEMVWNAIMEYLEVE